MTNVLPPSDDPDTGMSVKTAIDFAARVNEALNVGLEASRLVSYQLRNIVDKILEVENDHLMLPDFKVQRYGLEITVKYGVYDGPAGQFAGFDAEAIEPISQEQDRAPEREREAA